MKEVQNLGSVTLREKQSTEKKQEVQEVQKTKAEQQLVRKAAL